MSDWRQIETAPEYTPFLAAVEVHINGKFSHWDMHVVWRDDETGDIALDCEQGWNLSDYSHWMPLPEPPPQAAKDKVA